MNSTKRKTQFETIALDIAGRIAEGEIPEGAKLRGRSTLSSEYNASPETIRKAIVLLANMKVVEVQNKSGSVVISAENARRFFEERHQKGNIRALKEQLRQLLQKEVEINHDLNEVCSQILESSQAHIGAEDGPPHYEVAVPAWSSKLGKDLGSLRFWQATGATVIAIRRGRTLLISPGPYAELLAGDTLIFVGNPPCVSNVHAFLEED